MIADDIKTICAVGTGAMGAGTALCFAIAGYEVRLYGRAESSLVEGRLNITNALQELEQHGLIPTPDLQAIQGRITYTTDLAAAAKDADCVIESIKENMGAKRHIFTELDKLCPAYTIFATNTSSLSPTEIAKVLSSERAPRFVAVHLFNPPHLMSLVEVVAGKQTSEETMQTAYDLVQKIAKDPVRLDREIKGYIVNRVQAAMWASAYSLLEQGHAAQKIDDVVRRTLGRRLQECGLLESADFEGPEADIANTVKNAMQQAAQEVCDQGIASVTHVNQAIRLTLGLRLPVTGPVLSADLTGLDVVYDVMGSLGYAIPSVLATAVANERLGYKTGRGIYSLTKEEWTQVRASRVAAIVSYLKGKDAQAVPVRSNPETSQMARVLGCGDT